MSFKKTMSLFLVLVMAVSLLSGCASGEKTTETNVPESDTSTNAPATNGGSDAAEGITFPLAEPVEFTCMAGMNGEYAISSNPAMVKAMEDANIKINFIDVLGADLAEKQNLVIGSGEYPDFFYKTWCDGYKYGQQGIMIPLEDLIREYAPNLTKLLDERDGWQYITAADGHVYGFPEIDAPTPANLIYWINKDWMANLGLKEPANFDELYEVLKAFKEQDANGNGDPNDEIPFLCDTYCNPMMLMQYVDFPYSALEKVGVKDGKLFYVPTSEEFKEFLGYIAKLYQEGLIYEYTYTTDHDQIPALAQSGDIAGSFFDAGAFLTVGRGNDKAYMGLTPWADCLPIGSGINANTMCITDKCENPEILVAWMDRFYSQEGGVLAWMGVEGVSWQYNDEGDWEWILGNGYGDDVSTVRASAALQGAQTHPSVQPDIWMTGMSSSVDPEEVYLNSERVRMAEHGVVPLPAMSYTEEQYAEIATIKTDTDGYFDQYVAQVVTGEISLEDSWDEFVATMNNMGALRLTELYQAIYDNATK